MCSFRICTFISSKVIPFYRHTVLLSEYIYFLWLTVRQAHYTSGFRTYLMALVRIGFNLNVILHPVCSFINPITVDNFVSLFICAPVDQTSDSMMAQPKAIHFVGWGRSFRLLLSRTGLMIFFCFRFQVVLFCGLWISDCLATRCICLVLVSFSSQYSTMIRL